MRSRTIDQLKELYLVEIYNASGGRALANVEVDEVRRRLAIDNDEFTALRMVLLKSPLLWHDFGGKVRLSGEGVSEAQRIMEKTYAEEELIVLQTAAELGKSHPRGWVMWDDLKKALPKLNYALTDIVKELENKHYFDREFDEGVKVGSRGFEFLQKRVNRDPGLSININTHGHGSPVTIGDGNTVTSNVSVNPEFDSAIRALVELVSASSMATDDVREALAELDAINRLALQEKNEGIIKRGLSRIGTLKTILETAGLLGQAAQYLPALGAAFGS